jgi:uncharacterized protein YndB with AHSA1/START domain
MVAPAEPELTIERVFQAPRALVWQAWVDPKRMIQWMGPRDHPAVHLEGEIKVGGKWRGCLRGPDGEDLWQGGEYREIVEPERLVFTFYWEGDDGKPENVMLIALTFLELGPSETKMTMHQTAFRDADQRDRHRGGWTSTFDRLAEMLAST